MCEEHKSGWIIGCKTCELDHYDYHFRNEDIWDLYCSICTPRRKAEKAAEALRRKLEGIEKRKRTMAAKKEARLKAHRDSSPERIRIEN